MSITTLKRAATTAKTAARNVEHADDVRAAVELIESLTRELDRYKRDLRGRAVDAGLAVIAVTDRETAPSKARYIELHGADAFDANKTVSKVRKFVWLD